MKKNNILIIILVSLILLMTVAFAAFSSLLTITGTSNIDNSWDVAITNIVSKDKVGEAENNGAPIYTRTSATFKTTLVSPGDSMTYDVTIENKGTIDAKVSKITLTDSNNPAIIFETSGIQVNDILESGGKQIFKVIVRYSDSVTSQPDTLNSSLTVKLDYVQK